jgi:hypothetical protein
VRDALPGLIEAVTRYRALAAAVAGHGDVAAAAAATDADADADVDYALAHTAEALDTALHGLGRVAAIVRSMKEFAHPDRDEKTLVDLRPVLHDQGGRPRHRQGPRDRPQRGGRQAQRNAAVRDRAWHGDGVLRPVTGRIQPRDSVTVRAHVTPQGNLSAAIHQPGRFVPEWTRLRWSVVASRSGGSPVPAGWAASSRRSIS